MANKAVVVHGEGINVGGNAVPRLSNSALRRPAAMIGIVLPEEHTFLGRRFGLSEFPRPEN